MARRLIWPSLSVVESEGNAMTERDGLGCALFGGSVVRPNA